MERRSHCPLDCPDACSLVVTTDDDRVVSVDGSHRNPLTEGYICSKVRRLPDLLYGPERLLEPAIRVGPKGSGEVRPATWDEALGLITDKMREAVARHGGESILPLCYGGSNGLLTQDSTDARLFRRLGASNLARTVCAVPSTLAAAGLYGKMPGVAFQDYVHARLIVVWGCNPTATGIHLLPHIKEARRRGARLVVVDPRRNRLARQADLHLPVRPGSDVAVALAVANWLFDNGAADLDFLDRNAHGVEQFRRRAAAWPVARAADVSGIDPQAIETLARWYAETSPAVIRAGWGMERNRNGAASVAAVLALPAVAGKFGVRGGGYTMSNSRAFTLDATVSANEPPSRTRTLNMNRLGRDLRERDDPPVTVLFAYNCNPVATLPEQERVIAGMLREDLFTAVFEQVFTDTARYADVILPATVFVEHDEMSAGYGAMLLQHAPAAVPAAGQARPNYAVFEELTRRLGLDRPDDPSGPDGLAAAILGNGRGAILATGEPIFPDFGATPIQFVDLLPRTSSGKIELLPATLEEEAPGGLYTFRPDPATEMYPLALVSPATGRTVSSTFGQLVRDQVPLRLHPDDAAARGIATGDRLRVFNGLGEVHCLAKVTDQVRPGVVFLPKGLWSHSTLNGRTSNALVSDAFTDVGGGATFNDARVQVGPLVDRELVEKPGQVGVADARLVGDHLLGRR